MNRSNTCPLCRAELDGCIDVDFEPTSEQLLKLQTLNDDALRIILSKMLHSVDINNYTSIFHYFVCKTECDEIQKLARIFNELKVKISLSQIMYKARLDKGTFAHLICFATQNSDQITGIQFYTLADERFGLKYSLFLSKFKNIESLNLSLLDQGTIIDIIKDFPNLKELDLGLYHVTSDELSFIKDNLPNLTHFGSVNRNNDEMKMICEYFPNLTSLSLPCCCSINHVCPCHIENETIHSMTQLKDLKRLDISESYISDSQYMIIINELPELEELIVGGVTICGILDNRIKYNKLRTLDLSMSKVSPRTYNLIKARIPNMEIIFMIQKNKIIKINTAHDMLYFDGSYVKYDDVIEQIMAI
jgi:Leucine-rich repeat (LRR) protein